MSRLAPTVLLLTLSLAGCSKLLTVGSPSPSPSPSSSSSPASSSPGASEDRPAPSNEPSSTDRAAKGSYGDFTRAGAESYCLIGGTINARCMEVAGFAQPTASSHARGDGNRRGILECFEGLRHAFERKDDRIDWYQLRKVASLALEIQQYPKLAADPASKACIAVADEHTNGEFSMGVALQAEKDRLRPIFEGEFQNACRIQGASIQLNELGDPLRVVLNTQPRNKNTKVAVTGSTPSYQVLCTGDVLVARADGTKLTNSPSYRDKNAVHAKASCMSSCAAKWDYRELCGGGTRANDRACQSLCEQRCR